MWKYIIFQVSSFSSSITNKQNSYCVSAAASSSPARQYDGQTAASRTTTTTCMRKYKILLGPFDRFHIEYRFIRRFKKKRDVEHGDMQIIPMEIGIYLSIYLKSHWHENMIENVYKSRLCVFFVALIWISWVAAVLLVPLFLFSFYFTVCLRNVVFFLAHCRPVKDNWIQAAFANKTKYTNNVILCS